MILEEETFKKFGYYPRDLKLHSNKKVLAKCDNCEVVRTTSKNAYHDLCKSCVRIGKHHSKITKQKIREALRGKSPSKETKSKLSESTSGENNSMYGKHHSEETKQKIRNSLSREKSWMWKGGISFKPYCIKFNKDFKERVREYWNRRCVICNMDEIENGRKLDVHHVTYIKEACCDDSPLLFVALCKSCHHKVHGNEDFWLQEFKRMIYSRNIDGECFYTKEEMKNYLENKKEN